MRALSRRAVAASMTLTLLDLLTIEGIRGLTGTWLGEYVDGCFTSFGSSIPSPSGGVDAHGGENTNDPCGEVGNVVGLEQRVPQLDVGEVVL